MKQSLIAFRCRKYSCFWHLKIIANLKKKKKKDFYYREGVGEMLKKWVNILSRESKDVHLAIGHGAGVKT